ncbi:MAG: hypothetical protein NXY59_01515 [Aigarchaeota archaeon]|nr:hypothetical protein [Candidatus Pelearchaeum maunauluense]
MSNSVAGQKVLGLIPVTEVTLIVPRRELEDALRELYRFEEFHPIRIEGAGDPVLRELEQAAERGYIPLEVLIQELGLREGLGVINQLMGKTRIEQREYTADDIRKLLEKLDAEAKPLIEELNMLVSRRKQINERLGELKTLLAALSFLSNVDVDLDSLARMRRFYAVFALAPSKDVAELSRALQEAAVLEFPLTPTQSAVLIVCSKKLGEKIEKTLRGLGISPFTLPPDFPRKPAEAYKRVSDEVAKLEEELNKIEARLREVSEKEAVRIISLRDSYYTLKNAVHSLGGGGPLKRFAVIKGYIPKNRYEQFINTFSSRYPVFSREPGAHHHHHDGHKSHETEEDPPSLVKYPAPQKPFENITLIQGLPGYFEVDPTPFVAIFFSIFYGIMFADFGQGLVLLLFGLFMASRTRGRIRLWGQLLTLLGASAAVGGFLIGEVFGFPLGKYIGSPQILHLVEEAEGAKQFSITEVQRLLLFTIVLGVVHLMVGYALSVVKFLKAGEKVEALTSRLPTLIMYVFGIFFALAFFGAGGRIEGIMSSTEPAPFIGVPTYIVGTMGVVGAAACMFVIMFGRYLYGLADKAHKISFSAAMGQGMLELMENVIQFLSNTISYARLTILLIVHIALLLLLNNAWEALGPASIPALILGNIGIMLLEGLLAFIQALRLHLYEFFTKFYDGAGRPFRKILEETDFARIQIR